MSTTVTYAMTDKPIIFSDDQHLFNRLFLPKFRLSLPNSFSPYVTPGARDAFAGIYQLSFFSVASVVTTATASQEKSLYNPFDIIY